MRYPARILISLYLFAAAFLLTGCIDKTIYPATDLEIVSVVPYALIPTATDTASLPAAQINFKSLSKVPCNLKSYSITYYTAQGEEIAALTLPQTSIETKIDAETEVSVEIRPYTSRVIDLLELSSSQISPIMARIKLSFYDYNGNWLEREANCLLYQYSEAAE